MAEFTKKVFKVGQSEKTNKNGKHWMVLTVEGKGAGETKQENIFDDKIRAQFSSGPGVYKLTYEKKGEYWNITAAEFVAALPRSGNGHSATAAAPAAPAASPAVSSKASVASSALEAAARIAASEVAAGIWKEPVDITDRAALLFRALAREAKQFVSGEQSAPKTQAEQREPAGA